MLYLPNLPMRSCPTSLISLYSWSLSMCCWSSSSLYLWTWFSRKVRVNLDLQSIGWQSPTSTPTPPQILKFRVSLTYSWLSSSISLSRISSFASKLRISSDKVGFSSASIFCCFDWSWNVKNTDKVKIWLLLLCTSSWWLRCLKKSVC